MNINKKSKLLSLLITMILLSSMLVVFSGSVVAQEIEEVSKTDDLICGEKIWVNCSGLTEDTRYYIYIEDEGGDYDLLDDKRANEDGEISLQVNMPYRNPLGGYSLALCDGDPNGAGTILDNTMVYINNTFWVRYKVAGTFIDHVIFNKSYEDASAFEIYVYNWTGSKYELFKKSVTIELQNPASSVLYTKTTSTGIWDIDITFNYEDGANLETNYFVAVEYNTDTDQNSTAKLPVKLDVTATLPTDVEWSDTVTISGYVRDGNGDGIADYTVKLYSPGSWHEMDSAVTYSSGRFSLSAPTDDGSAGTWYLGTEMTGTYRIDETDKLDIAEFIQYFSFDVASDSSARVNLVSPDEVISGFDQTLNVSVYNSWDDDYFDEMWIHITGLDAIFDSTSYDADDIIVVHANSDDWTSANGKYAYYEFDIRFNETGTATIIVTHPQNNTVYEDNDNLEANISGSKTFQVVSPDDMNILVSDMPEQVIVNEISACQWKNGSTTITIEVYGDDQDTPMNATIAIAGCGIDETYDEEDAEFLVSQGIYQIPISPKHAGTLTITVTNETDNMTGSKDFAIKGLSGSVTTSIGDDLEMSVQSTETITANIANGQYAEVHLTYYDENWVFIECLNDSIGDNTAGNGLNGEFTFLVE
ncbi:MAG: carboxypeptidase-like regulatory domain-containing protein, partial [Candidatus Thermoplasmatota archaeon]|nr:carboxypeptidase-like regulatory domain-containing protein [Candidatus Thermoplasmatota archaeon]MBU1941220.1 carboxypeptidase-like regulatory domain-containing protein [Candidatus Thermoplasmatota archaeon]